MNRVLGLNDVALGAGVVATRVWMHEDQGPIVLVALQNGSGGERCSRLDLQKSMFIDPVPHPVSSESVVRLVTAVREAEARGG